MSLRQFHMTFTSYKSYKIELPELLRNQSLSLIQILTETFFWKKHDEMSKTDLFGIGAHKRLGRPFINIKIGK